MTAPLTESARRRALAIVFITVVIDLLGFGMVMPLIPRYGEALLASKGTLGLLMASFSAMQFLFAPLWGAVSDRIGRRPVLLAGLLGSVVFYSLFGFASSLGGAGQWLGHGALFWMFVARIGAGIAGGTISSSQAYIADVTDRSQRSRGMALIGVAFGVGFTFGPLLGALFVWDTQPGQLPAAPGYLAAGLSFVALIWALVQLPESPRNVEDRSRTLHGWQQLSRLGLALRHPVLGLTLLSSFLTVFSFAQFESTLSLFTETLGLTVGKNYLVFAYIGFILAAAQGGLVRRLAPRLGEYRMALIGVSLLTAGLLLIALCGLIGSFGLLMAVLPLSVIGFAFTNPAFQALLSLNSSADEQGEILGLGQSVSALARIFGPWLGISLQKVSVLTPYWVSTAVLCVAWVLTISLRRRLPAAQSPSA